MHSVGIVTYTAICSKIVRHALGRAVAAIADVELYGPSGHASSSQAGTQHLAEWPELFPFLTSNTQAAAAEHREVAIFILHSILESTRESFVEQMMDGLFNIFAVTLNDQNEDVRLMTLKALGKMAEFIDLDEKALIVGCRELTTKLLAHTFPVRRDTNLLYRACCRCCIKLLPLTTQMAPKSPSTYSKPF